MHAVEAVEVACGHQQAARRDQRPSPAAQAQHAEDADDQQRADSENAVLRSAEAEGSVHRSEGVEHRQHQQIHADQRHAGEHALALAGGDSGEVARAEAGVLCGRQRGRGLMVFSVHGVGLERVEIGEQVVEVLRVQVAVGGHEAVALQDGDGHALVVSGSSAGQVGLLEDA